MRHHLTRAGEWALSSPRRLVELFAFFNLAFLTVDIYLAHSVVEFKYWQTWVPFFFSLIAPALLVPAWLMECKGPRFAGRWLGILIGAASVFVGIAGMYFHLEDGFFVRQTLKNLVYTAPFAAPLAYTGIGLLLILDRTVRDSTLEWAQWVVVLALGGFIGNFVLGLADHAQNGFFLWQEWIPVASAAIACSFLAIALVTNSDRRFLAICGIVMAVQVLVGLLGFYYHVTADLHGVMRSLWDNFVYGAPAFAPLLFANLAMLAGIGLWVWSERIKEVPLAAGEIEGAKAGA